MQSQVAAQVPPPAPAQSSGPTEPSSGPAQPEAVTEAAVAETEVYDDGAEDYFLDCSVCKKRGLNLDPNSRLVACDNCDRWEHVVCHRKADERAGRPKRDWENDPFLCEDCEGLEESVILPSAPKRERSEKQKAGAKKGAEKRKAKAAAERAKKTAANPKPKPKPAAKGIARTTAPAAAPAVLSNGSNPTSHATLNQGQGPSAIQAPSQSQRSPALQMNTQAVGNYQQISQPSRSPYQPPPPHQPSFASGPSPSLQPQSQQYPPQFQPQNQQYQAHQQGMQPQQMQQSTHSQHYLPQQPQNPHYAMQPQHAFQGGVPAYQGNFAPRNAFAGSSAPQMYGQQGAFMPNTGVQQHGPSGYQSGYANFAQQHMPQGNLAVPQQHQHQQAHLIQQPGGSGNSGQLMPAPSHQRPPPQGQ